MQLEDLVQSSYMSRCHLGNVLGEIHEGMHMLIRYVGSPCAKGLMIYIQAMCMRLTYHEFPITIDPLGI